MAWTAAEGYRLGSQSPANNTTWGPGRVELPRASVAPGEEVTFAFPVTAPATPGTRSFQWRMQQEGVEWFGDASPSMEITVADAGEDPQCPNLRAQILQ